jgi:XRE family transcriptional regulator, aerobic/anaerobic benzoate catabolism transcriptional regulator
VTSVARAVEPASLLETVGRAVRTRREQRGWSRRELAKHSGVSERFLAQLETGDGNISLRRFADVAHALGTSPSALLAAADVPSPAARPIALLGVRGAGKSSVGAALAKRLGVAFVELDQRIELAAGLPLGEVFALHGEAYYRRLEREVLAQVLAEPAPLVLATGGSIVNDPTNYAFLRARCQTIWLRARPEDHWNRVVAQGDLRPMAENPHAFAELRALLAAREKLYARADHAIDTSGRRIAGVVSAILELGASAQNRRVSPATPPPRSPGTT